MHTVVQSSWQRGYRVICVKVTPLIVTCSASPCGPQALSEPVYNTHRKATRAVCIHTPRLATHSSANYPMRRSSGYRKHPS